MHFLEEIRNISQLSPDTYICNLFKLGKGGSIVVMDSKLKVKVSLFMSNSILYLCCSLSR